MKNRTDLAENLKKVGSSEPVDPAFSKSNPPNQFSHLIRLFPENKMKIERKKKTVRKNTKKQNKLNDTKRNRKKQKETGRNSKKKEETGINRNKQEETGRNRKK